MVTRPPLFVFALVAAASAGCGGGAREAPPPATAPETAEAPDPAPRDDGIQIEGTLGTLEQEQIDGPFGMREGDINACYQRATAKLWYLGGHLEVKVRVGAGGEVKDATVVAPIGNYAVEKCILDITKGLTFGRPRGGAEAEFNYSWNFQPKATIRDWGEDDPSGHFAKKRNELSKCAHPKGGAEIPIPPGLRITFFVTPGGRVSSVGLGADGPLVDEYATCVVTKVAGWKFDDPLGKIAKATYQFQ